MSRESIVTNKKRFVHGHKRVHGLRLCKFAHAQRDLKSTIGYSSVYMSLQFIDRRILSNHSQLSICTIYVQYMTSLFTGNVHALKKTKSNTQRQRQIEKGRKKD